ncbi:MAG TPA: hypothetical protein PK833_03470 [Vicingus sp.]|nr:hypothetical protein [Vicingus sp.]
MTEQDRKLIFHYLVPGERPIQIWRHHWLWWLQYVWIPFGITILITVVAVVSDTFLLLGISFVSLLISLCITIHWRKRVVFLTNHRVGEVGGLFSKIQEKDIAGLRSVQNIDVQKPGLKAFFFGFTNYLLQSGHGVINLQAYPPGIDTAIWSAKTTDNTIPNTSTTTPINPKIIVH